MTPGAYSWRIKNPERAKASYDAYWRSHRPQVYAKNRRYRERHPDRVRAQRRAVRERDPELTRARKRAERERNKDWYRAYEEWRYYNYPGRKEAAKARAAAWAREHRTVMLVYGRVRRARLERGWSLDEALSTPVRGSWMGTSSPPL